MSNTTPLEYVEPVATLAPYIGGKNRLHAKITEMIASVPHGIYAEPFVGMGGIFFKRTRRPKAEVINDINGDVVTLFRVLNNHYAAFMDMLKYQITSRSEFERLRSLRTDMLTDMQRAAVFLYLQRVGYGGKVAERTFGVSQGNSARFDVNKLSPMLADVHERLSGVTIENLEFERFIALYDRPETLFYCDPPYFGTEDFYGPSFFLRSDHERLRDCLRGIAGTFILSINDAQEIRELYDGFYMEQVTVQYSAAGGEKGREVQELIISNRKIEKAQTALF